MLELTPQEQAIIDEYLQEHYRRTRTAVRDPLEARINRWSKFVERVEIGYPLAIYNYQGELGGRDILEGIIQIAPDHLQKKVTQELAPWDNRLFHATKEIGVSLLPPLDETKKQQWWWFRIPIVMPEHLEQDLRHEEILD